MIRKIYVEECGEGCFELYQNDCRNDGGIFIADCANIAETWKVAKEFAVYHGVEEIIWVVPEN